MTMCQSRARVFVVGLTRRAAAWDDEMIAPGILVGGGALRPVRETTTLRVRGGELMVSDGPFAETKEQIAGYRSCRAGW